MTIARFARVASLALLFGILGCKSKPPMGASAPAHAGEVGEAAGAAEARIWIPLDETTPLRGPATAAVTLVVFCDFQSPYCARITEHLQGLRREYGAALRIQYRHNPLPIYPDSQLAGEASAAAAEQGKFWAYHDTLFKHQNALDRASLERYGQELGLDMDRFRDAIASERARLKVDGDSILAANIQVRGAPVLFVNGRPVRGLRDHATYKRVIDEELVVANALLKEGTPPKSLYQRIAHVPPSDSTLQHDKHEGIPPANPNTVYKVDLGESPTRGPADAKVTVVLWSDFECERCGSFEKELDAVAAAYPRDVRIVWKFRPIPDHPAVMLASEAALAAGREGKFWPMHDLLFANPAFDRDRLEGYARKLKLDMARFREALDDRPYTEHVSRDLELSENLAIRNLPALFINGRRLAHGEGKFTAAEVRILVAEEMKHAERLLDQGISSARLYEHIIAGGDPGAGFRPEERPPLPKGSYPVDVGSSPIRGPQNAPVTIVTFSDFQCPYCSRLERTLDQLRNQYGDAIRVVWKDAPSTDIHPDAMGAHVAARAAAEQGRFWEMHDKIFSRPYVLGRGMLERHAASLGLDMDRFRSALDSGKFEPAVREDTDYGVSLAGPVGTPAVFVNGQLVPGALPIETFRRVIDEALQREAR
ncbi:thioredoxin domain-containing protein [Pendulispora rubella]|uniref:Thioredoxin domain-containing protein n=1 Tax=Pendulispora rubella TaxID=2741070 RepID=A0ABZ2KYX9_9BACT